MRARMIQESTFNEVVLLTVRWLTRIRSPWTLMFYGGLGTVCLSLSGIVVKASYGDAAFMVDTGSGTPALMSDIAFIAGLVLIIVGTGGMIFHAIKEYKADEKKRVLIIEQRGLRDTSDTPLEGAVPKNIKGKRDPVLIDIRERIKDGVVTDAEKALERVMALSLSLEQKRSGFDRSNVSVVYGGLLPVPFTFLTGMIIDDESAVLTFDWNRHDNRWQPLNGQDDGDRFIISDLNLIPANADQVVLAVSVSYKVDMKAIGRTFGSLPIVSLNLPNGHQDCHWSEEKQKALAQDFLKTITALNNKNVGKIHLVLAAPNSVVFRFGRTYDKRNLPKLIVHQYERSNAPPYPWGVLMPTHGVDVPRIERS